MKKSKKHQSKNSKSKKKLNPEEIITDITKVINFIDKIDTMDFENLDINKLEKDAELLKEAIEDKYGNVEEGDIDLGNG